MYGTTEIVRAQTDPKFREQFILENMGSVRAIVNQRLDKWRLEKGLDKEKAEEAFQEGMIGFMEAINKFNPSRVVHGAYYYVLRSVRNHVKKYLVARMKRGWAVDEKRMYYISRMVGNRLQFLMRNGEWASATGKRAKDFQPFPKGENWVPGRELVSMEKKLNPSDPESPTIGETRAAKNPDIFDRIEKKDLMLKFRRFLRNQASLQERRIAILMLGMHNGRPLSCRRTGRIVKCSHTTVSALFNSLMKRFQLNCLADDQDQQLAV